MKALFSDVDIMLHAGDMTSSSVFDYLSNWDRPGCQSNMDDFDLKARLPESRVEEVEGMRIGSSTVGFAAGT
jgi:predicted phosphodiesterase